MPAPSQSYEVAGPLDPAAVAEALAPAFGLRAEAPARHGRTYLDTFDGRLHGPGLTLVHEAGELVLTDAGHDVVARERWARVPKLLLVADLPAGPLATALGGPVEMRALQPLVRLSSREQLLRVLDGEEKTVVRLLTETPVVDGGARLPAHLHVVPVRGYEKQAAKVVALLEAALELTPAAGSIADDAIRAAGGVPGGVSSSPKVPLTAADTAAVAAARVSLRLLEVIEANLPGTLADLDTEYLHDFRVAVRRTRSLQRELRGAFPAEALREARAQFKRLQNVTGDTRDLDVYLLDFEDFAAHLPEARRADLEPLRRLLRRRRAGALRRMRRELRADDTAAMLADWAALLAAMSAGEAGGPDADVPLLTIASARIRTVHRQMVKAGRAIGDDTPAEALHDLRKKGKELRYLLEFFAPLYPAAVIKPFVSSLKALQDTLGRFQDREVQADLVASLAPDVHRMDDATSALMAMGLLVEGLHEQQRAARDEFGERFAAFAAPEQLAIVKETFA